MWWYDDFTDPLFTSNYHIHNYVTHDTLSGVDVASFNGTNGTGYATLSKYNGSVGRFWANFSVRFAYRHSEMVHSNEMFNVHDEDYNFVIRTRYNKLYARNSVYGYEEIMDLDDAAWYTIEVTDFDFVNNFPQVVANTQINTN